MSRKVGIIYFYKIMRDEGERFDEFLLVSPRVPLFYIIENIDAREFNP